ncbi:hypothetical protein HN937_03165, partial [Candidatus Poribacteria bacterium]|nr:hypothetical protein [Candidatus Poribacteria bacterium]
IDMQDSGRGFAPRFPFGQDGGVVLEAISKDLLGGAYTDKLVFTLAGQTLTWNDGVAVPVADGRYILEGQDGDFVVVAVIAAELPAANDSVDVTVSADVDRDIQQPAAIRGVRVHGVGPGNVVGNTGTLSLTGTMLSWNSDTASRAAGAPVDVAVPGVYVLNSERVSEADYLMVQVDSIRGAATEDLDIYPADGRAVTPLRTITGLEIMTVSDVVDEGNYDFTWDGTSSLSWSDGSPTNVTDADRPTLVPGNAEGTRFVVVRRTGAPLPAVAAKDRLFVNQTRLLRVYVTVNDNGGFTSTHLKPLAADESSGVALYRDANANGIFDGPGIDEFVPLLQTPVFSGVGSYTTTLYPDPAYRAAYLPNSHVAPHTGNDFFLAVQTTYDMSFGDRFSVSASVYEPTEPRDDLNGNPSFASGSSGTITSTSVTNTVFSDETTSPWTIDAGRNGVAAPQVLFGIDHFLGTTGVIHVQSLTFKLRSANGFDPDIDLKAMDEANPALRGVMLYADNGNGNFSTADTLIPCDIVTDYDAAAGIYTFTLLPIASNSATQVPVTSDGGSSDHFVCLNFAPGLDYGDELYCTVEVDGIEYSSGVGNAAARLQTHNLTATIKSTYGDLTSRVQTTVAGGLLVTDIGSTVANGYHQAQVFFDPDTNAYYLSWNGNVVEIDMLAVESYTLGTGNNSITVTFDPFAFCAEDTLVDGDGTTTDAAGVPDDATRGAALLPLFTVSNPAFAIGSLYYVDTDENGAWDAGEAIVLAVNAGAAFDDGTDGVILGSPAAADPLTAFGPADHLAVHDADGNGDYNDGEDIVRDTDGVYTLPCLDQLIDTDGVATAGTGGATLLVQGDELVSAHTVSVDAGAAVLGYAGLYYYDADGSGGYTPGDDIVARPAVGGVIVGPLVSVATDEVLHDGDDNGDGDDDDVPNDEVQVQVGDSLSQFVAEDYVAFERGGILPDGYELREDIFRARSETFAPTDFTWNFRVTNGSRAIRRYEAAAPVPFRDPEDAMTAVVGIDLANSGATGVTLDRLTLRFDNLYQFNATIDLRALSTGRAYAGRDAGVLLYRDADGNGLFDPEIDTLIQPASAPAWTSSGTEYRVTFNLDSDNLVDDEDMDGIYDFFAVVQPSAAANNYQQVDDGDRFRVRVRNGDMVLSKALN